MPTYDQFDVEHKGSFQSSSIDTVYFGVFGTPETATFNSGSRQVVGGKLAGLNLAVFEEYSVPFSLRRAYETGSQIGNLSRTVSLADSEEYFADSFVPHPVYILLEGGSLTETFTTSSTTPYHGQQWGIRPLGDQGIEVAYTTYPADVPADFPIGTDCTWHDHFPYQTQYKNLQKTLKQDGSLAETLLTNDGDYASFVARVTIYSYNPALGGSTPIYLQSWMTSNSSSFVWKEREIGAPDWSDLSKTFYGTGDGGKTVFGRYGENSGSQGGTGLDLGRYQPRFAFQYKPGASAIATSALVSIPLIRGFKFGVKNTIAEPATARFSRKHFGHVRDMLEQRQGYATINKKTGARIYAPVSVTFVSGTTSFQRSVWYASSSTTTDFNPRDSGIYDTFYRAGQPFFD